MAIKEVIRMGHPTLRKLAKKVDDPKSKEIQELVIDLKDSMEHYGGIGIAAPQINIPLQVAIIKLESQNKRYPDVCGEYFEVFINPEIEVIDHEPRGFWEGCLSVPGLRGYVERPKEVRVTYTSLTGERKNLQSSDFKAVVIQHELDHLFGKLYIDHIKDSRLLMYEQEYLEFHRSSQGSGNL